MMVTIVDDLSICEDCLIWQANADDSGFPDDVDMTCVTDPTVPEGHHVIVDGEELGFSWSTCELCRRPEGGNRYLAHLAEV